ITMSQAMVVLLLAALAQSTPPPLRTVGKGPMSAIDQPRQIAVRSAAEWGALWKENGANAPLPAVDFSREMVVGVFLGTRPTAGYGVEIVSAISTSGARVVAYGETAPPRDPITAQFLPALCPPVPTPHRAGRLS